MARPIMDSAQTTIKRILAVEPIDFKLLIKSFSPKIKRTKNGIPTANNTSKATSQRGTLVVSIIAKYSVISLCPQKLIDPKAKKLTTNEIIVIKETTMISAPISLANTLNRVKIGRAHV